MSKKALQAGVYLALLVAVSLLAVGLLANSVSKGFVANSILPLVSTPVQVTVTVKNSGTLQPIQGATVNCFVLGMLADSGTTNQAGSVTLWGYFEIEIQFKATATGYEEGALSTTIYYASGTKLVMLLTPSESGGEYGFINVYCLSDDDSRVTNVLISSSVGNVLTDSKGYAKVSLLNGADTLTFSDYDARIRTGSIWEPIDFGDYDRSIGYVSGSTWVAYVEQGGLAPGFPPSERFNFTDWILENWVLVVVGLLILILLRR